MKVAVTGSTGFLGAALLPALAAAGHATVRVVRGAPPPDGSSVRWDPGRGTIDASGLEASDAVVHLAGENIAAGRWTRRRKTEIRESRVRGTRFLAGTVARLARPPRVLVCASAVGFYGDRGDELLTEGSGPGAGFLPEVCRAWEEAAFPAVAAGLRVVHLRIGMVLAAEGGALPRMAALFRLGLGGVLGGGRQWMSWIALDDLAGIVLHVLEDETVRGPVNAVAPDPVTNREFTKALAAAVRRPAVLPVPAFALRLAVGGMADALLLASARVVPARLLAAGYGYRRPEIEGALRAALG